MKQKYHNILNQRLNLSQSEFALFEGFIEMLLVERSSSNNTIVSYLRDLSDLVIHLHSSDILLQNATNTHIEQYSAKLAARAIKATTLSRKISSIKQFYGFLLRDEIRTDDPSLNLIHPKIPNSVPKPLLLNQVEKLLEGAKTFQDGKDQLRNMLIIELLYATGMRISELITLKISSFVDIISELKLTKNSNALNEIKTSDIIPIIVSGKGNKERTVLLHTRAALLLVAYLEFREKFILPHLNRQLQTNAQESKPKAIKCDWVFPSITKTKIITHLTRQRCFQILKDIALFVGLNPSIISPHKIRHSFATHMLQNGADLRVIQELLGHISINSTQIYTKVNDHSLVTALEENHPLANKKIQEIVNNQD